MGTTRRFSELTAPQIRAMAESAIVVWPIAATEQHGPHDPTGTDVFLNDAIQKRLLESPPDGVDVLLLPTLSIGASHHHMPFGGTLSLPAIQYAQVLAAGVRCLLAQGHKKILLLNSHGGNDSPMKTALAEVATEASDAGALVAGVTYWDVAVSRWREALPNLKTHRMGHACELETSMLLSERPELVRTNLLADDPFAPAFDSGLWVAQTFAKLTRDGAIGYPESATKEAGETLLALAAEAVGDSLRALERLSAGA